jgi:hypothetical protein
MNAAASMNSGGLLNTIGKALGLKKNVPKNTNVNIAISATPQNTVMAIEEVKTNQPLAGGKRRKATRKARKSRKGSRKAHRKNKKTSRRSRRR